MPVKVVRYKNLDSTSLLVQDRGACDRWTEKRESKILSQRKVCICGKCSCRQHHCPIHHGPTAVHHPPEVGMATETDYKRTFQAPPIGTRPRGLKVPVSISHLTSDTQDLATEHIYSYQEHQGVSKVKSCKPIDTYHESHASLTDETSYNSDYPQPKKLQRPKYGLPLLTKKHLESGDLQLKWDGRKEKALENVHTWNPRELLRSKTQYLEGGIPFTLTGRVPGRLMHLPVQDSLNLFHRQRSKSDPAKSVSMMTYEHSWAKQPKPRTSCKSKEDWKQCSIPFEGVTTNSVCYKPVLLEEKARDMVQLDEAAAKNSVMQQQGERMKKIQHFAGPFYSETTSQAHFSKKDTIQRRRYGDATERTFKQSELPFLSQSVSQTTYVPLKGQPADICRPLDVRFGKGEDQKEIPFANETSYKDMFQPQEIQQPQQCLAHALLNAKLTN